MTDFKSELRDRINRIRLEALSDAELKSPYDLIEGSWHIDIAIDDIIALFISKGWVSPENAARVQEMVKDMANIANNAFRVPTIQYIKPNKAMTKAQNLMTGQEWYDKFNAEISKSRNGEYYGIRQMILKAAKRASGLADIKSRIE